MNVSRSPLLKEPAEAQLRHRAEHLYPEHLRRISVQRFKARWAGLLYGFYGFLTFAVPCAFVAGLLTFLYGQNFSSLSHMLPPDSQQHVLSVVYGASVALVVGGAVMGFFIGIYRRYEFLFKAEKLESTLRLEHAAVKMAQVLGGLTQEESSSLTS